MEDVMEQNGMPNATALAAISDEAMIAEIRRRSSCPYALVFDFWSDQADRVLAKAAAFSA